MLQYDKIDASEGIGVNKTSFLNECMLCHYWYFKDVGFKLEKHVCNGCHEFNNYGVLVRKYSNIERKRRYFLVYFVEY